MATPAQALHFAPRSTFDEREQATLAALWDSIQQSQHPDRGRILGLVAHTVDRVDALADALAHFPSIFQETVLGKRRRSLSTLVDHLAQGTDANFEFLLPTRAIVGRSLVMAELNAWRLFSYVCDEVLPRPDGQRPPLAAEVEVWLHSCIHTKLAEEVLSSISQVGSTDRSIRVKAVAQLSTLWENRETWRVENFFPLLEATWNARRRIRVSVGTMLGVSEIFRLLQAGCDPEFVDYFSRNRCSDDERDAFAEFLIGVPTEQITSLSQLMKEEGKSSLSPEEAAEALGREGRHLQATGRGVEAYEFFRQRYLQAAARRLRNLPGPRRTAEEYVMIYFLDRLPGDE